MPIPFAAPELAEDGAHVFRVHPLDQSVDWLQLLADGYVALRTECATPISAITLDGVDVIDGQGVLARLQGACVPFRREDNFDVVRSDFGETLAYSVLEQVDGTAIGYKSVRDRELTQSPGRGIDIVGIEVGEKLTLVLGEVKVSDEKKSPPKVVDTARDGLRRQQLSHMKDRAATAKKIWDQSRRVGDRGTRDRLFEAALLLERDRLDRLRIIACCVLVRSAARSSSSDPGTFRSAPADYAPADVRFLSIVVPNGVEQTVKAWYALLAKAQSEAA